jgi:hypothetical protein
VIIHGSIEGAKDLTSAESPSVITARYFNAHAILVRIRRGLRDNFKRHIGAACAALRTTKIAWAKEFLIET